MINKIKGYFTNIDKLTYKIMKNGLSFCFILSILSAFILLTYCFAPYSMFFYYIGLSLFKLGCSFGVEFIICGLVMDSIKKQLI